MALFGKKSGDTSGASGTATAKGAKSDKEKKGGLFGRKKGSDAAPDTSGLQMPGANGDAGSSAENGGFEDFSDFTAASSELGFESPALNLTAPRPKVLNGTSVGLNIGTASIKVVELQAKGGNISVTGIGSVPTPPESISNGVVMSVGALQHAIRDAFKNAGIKSKQVTLSVSGTGALVVRVIEVPRMSDAELAESMKQDFERYIPFPPSEVIMDFKALRELPAAPDSPNMDVLLAAAKHEIIDLNIKVLEEAKLNPRAIEVEPLAAARALSHAQVDADGQPARNVDYGRVTAIINIGASGTEISVMRGDVLVFTRIIPNGGNSLSQALVDYLGLAFTDAERMKHEWGDALAPHYDAPATPVNFDAPAAVTGDDWSEFGADDLTAGASNAAPATTPTANATTNAATASDDPFDDDFFNQGPQNQPREQHGQKQTPGDSDADSDPIPFSFDFADTTPENSAPDDINATTPMVAPDFDLNFSDEPAATPASTSASDATPASSFNFDLDAAPATDAPAASAFSFDFDMPTEAAPSATPAAPAVENEASAWSLDDLGLPDEGATTPAPADASAFDFSDIGAATPATPVADATQVTDASAAPDAELDLDQLFGSDDPTTQAQIASDDTATDALDFGALGATDDLGGGALAADALNTGFVTDMDDFGVGLGDDVSQGVDAATIYSILHPLLDELAGEIRRSLEYHASRYPDAVVQSIDVVGGGAKLTNIDVFLTQMLGIPTVVGNPLRAMSVKDGSMSPADAPLYAVAIGLALRDLLA